jgi:alkanesulfonate monooxygenase SsuD/methylene tetrahydromethanopterin reductase-like flavin-dependent oxidoreductase (luciferase family)
VELGRFAVWCSLEGEPLAQAVEAAQRIEALGYSALWQPMSLRRDAMVTASLQLAATRRLVLATGIATIYERSPLLMAAAQRTLFEQSGGRFLLGLGCSHAPITDALFGRAYEPPLTAMRAYIERMDAGLALPGLGPERSAGPAAPRGRARSRAPRAPSTSGCATTSAPGSASASRRATSRAVDPTG